MSNSASIMILDLDDLLGLSPRCLFAGTPGTRLGSRHGKQELLHAAQRQQPGQNLGLKTPILTLGKGIVKRVKVGLPKSAAYALSRESTTLITHPGGGPDGADISRPAEFLIDRTGTVRWEKNFTEDIRVRPRADGFIAQARSIDKRSALASWHRHIRRQSHNDPEDHLGGGR